jgi:hypothetical protein
LFPGKEIRFGVLAKAPRFLTRWSRLAQFTIAPCPSSKLALVLNVNAPVILKSSMNDPVLRDRVVAQVEEITKQYEQAQTSGEGWDQEVAPQKKLGRLEWKNTAVSNRPG